MKTIRADDTASSKGSLFCGLKTSRVPADAALKHPQPPHLLENNRLSPLRAGRLSLTSVVSTFLHSHSCNCIFAPPSCSRPQLPSARVWIVHGRKVNARAFGNMIFTPGVRKPVSLPRNSWGDMMQPCDAKVGVRMPLRC